MGGFMQKLLAIDDKMDNLITLTALLKNLMPGCCVITAQSGMEGIEMARVELPDAILLDVKMPDMDGFETCRRLMSDETTRHIPVIMITAIKTDPESRIKGLEIGANAFLAKPIDQHELVSQVKVALRIKKAEDALREQRNSLDRMVRERTAALRESEVKYRKAFMTSPDSFVITRLSDGMFVSVNKGFTEITGYAEAEVIGKTSLEINIWKHPEDRIKVVERLKAEGEVRNFEARFLAKDRAFYGLMSASIIELDGVPHILNVTRDITEAKQAEKEKATLEARLQQAQKMEAIGSLAGGIAHDLNNILFPISGLSEMLLDDIPPDTPEHKSIEQIYKSAQRGSDLVKQILAFSRQSNPQKLPIRIQPILKEVLKLAQAAIPKNIEITSRINTDCGMVSADPTQIHQIAMNLITNAFHATEGKGGTIDISLKEIAVGSFAEKEEMPFPAMPQDILSGKYACITVSDTGTGIEQSLIDKIFDPYFTTKELGKGTGLGLSVVHGIVKEHGGDIRVYSEVGKGTVFRVYLPLLEDTGDIKAAAFIKHYPTGHERILLVDDEAPIVRMVQMMLEKLGYQITVRTSSPDALAAFKANPDHFDLVISDRGMPNMTGDQLAAELISIRPGIPIILCTGFSNDNDAKRAKAMGVKGFLMKPVAIGDLATMVRSVLDDVANGVLMNDSGQADAITTGTNNEL
jgi:PAS domain S-box-containing protein